MNPTALDLPYLSNTLGLPAADLAQPCARLASVFADAFAACDFARSPYGPCVFATAPGRMELAGNHTDHQGGCVISAAIDQRMYALARPNGTSRARVAMEGFGRAEIDLLDPAWRQPVPEERGTSKSLVRGMAAWLAEAGFPVAGFDLAVISNVPAGFGVSSSAAFEVLVGAVLAGLFAPHMFRGATPCDAVSLALAAVETEREFFGKPCGAQDQIACTVGGVLHMDFAQNPPLVESLSCDFSASDHVACLIDTACDHALFNDQFAYIPGEMRAVAHALGVELLGQADPTAFLGRLPQLRADLGDRPVLRALHFFDENRRVAAQRAALEANGFDRFLQLVRQSGASSAQFLQNVSPQPVDAAALQPAAVVLALCEHLLEGRGAARIHGGGFGGSVLAFVPRDAAQTFAASMNAALGYDACCIMEPGAPGVRTAVLP